MENRSNLPALGNVNGALPLVDDFSVARRMRSDQTVFDSRDVRLLYETACAPDCFPERAIVVKGEEYRPCCERMENNLKDVAQCLQEASFVSWQKLFLMHPVFLRPGEKWDLSKTPGTRPWKFKFIFHFTFNCWFYSGFFKNLSFHLSSLYWKQREKNGWSRRSRSLSAGWTLKEHPAARWSGMRKGRFGTSTANRRFSVLLTTGMSSVGTSVHTAVKWVLIWISGQRMC